MYRGFVFDLFGTLVDEISGSVHDEMSRVLGVDPELFRPIWRRGYDRRTRGEVTAEACLEELRSELGITLTPAVVEYIDKVREEHVARALASARPQIVAVIRQLAEGGTPIGLLSNASPEVPRLWPSYALAPHFQAPVFSCEVGMMKPEEGVYRLACERLALPPEASLFVGDGGDNELLGALAAGMTPVQVGASRAPVPGVHLRIASVQELPALLRSLPA